MELRIQNFGKIKDATIKWEGLTVIAGKNDTGKSTIGKLFYVVTKSFAKYVKTYNNLAGLGLFYDLHSELGLILRNENRRILSSNPGLLDDIEIIFKKLQESFLTQNSHCNLLDIDVHFKAQILDVLKKISTLKFSNDTINSVLNKISNKLSSAPTKEEMFKTALYHYMKDSFHGNYNNSLDMEAHAYFEYFLNETKNLSVEILKNRVFMQYVDLDDKYPFFKDISLIDFPEIIDERFKNFGPSNLDWTDDLLDKTISLKSNYKEDIKNIEFLDNFWTKVLGDSILYVEKESQTFKYKVSGDASSLNIVNIASGTKSFSILYLLIKSGIINRDTPIILDEPENHLHPEWQIEYAKFITTLVANGFSVLLTSHSPIFIQALLKYSAKDEYSKTRNRFYLANKIDNTNYVNMEEVTDSPNKIFINLTSPEDILWQ